MLGFEILEAKPELARARFDVTDATKQEFGIVHGGTYAAAAEYLSSVATHVHVAQEGRRALGQTNHTTFLRPVSEGSVTLAARRRHGGRTSWVWDVDFEDDAGRLCAISRVIIAVR